MERRRAAPRTREGVHVLASSLFSALVAAGCGATPADLPEGPGYGPLSNDVPAWTATGSMSAARELHTATLLGNGQVLVTGGQKQGAFDTGDVYFDTAELYSPTTGAFSLTGSMASKRVAHVATRLTGGEVLVAGGSGSATSATTAELFEPATGAFMPAGTLNSGRSGAAAVVLADGSVLLTGGDTAGTAEVYDPVAGTFTPVAPLLTARSDHTATLLPNGAVLVTGGKGTAGALASAEIFDPTAGTWAHAASMTAARTSHTATLLSTGAVLVTGGSGSAGALASTELYHPSADGWTTAPPMESSRASHTATLLPNGGVLVAGGLDATSSAERSTELFDPDAGHWVSLGSMNHSRLLHTATPLAAGKVLVAGGEDQSSAEVYAPGGNGEACDVGRACASGFCVDGVCCNIACDSKCQSCALASAMGTCTLATPGTDPRHDCGQGASCDDVCGLGGICKSRVGEVCQPAACAADGAGRIVEATCATEGGACSMEIVGCGAYGCDEGTGACLTTCASIADCAAGYACDTSGRCVEPPDVADPNATSCALGRPAHDMEERGGAWAAGLLALAAVGRRCARRRGRAR